MEFLQTIWEYLNMPNELFINILIFPLAIIENFLTLLFFTSILNISSTWKQKFLYVISFSVVATLSQFIIGNSYYPFINILACPILIYFIFKTTILKSILSEIISFVIFFMLGFITMTLFTTLFNVYPSVTITIPTYKILYSSILYSMAFSFYFICKKLKINIDILDKLNSKNNIILLVNFIVGIIAIGIQAYILTTYNDYIPIGIIILCISSSLLYFLLSLYSLFRTNKLEIVTMNLEEEKLYNHTLTILNDDISSFKHDFNNIVNSIGSYLKSEDMPGLKTY